ncbi:hypothetical protein KI387_041574, partial [Taxus chinensis]
CLHWSPAFSTLCMRFLRRIPREAACTVHQPPLGLLSGCKTMETVLAVDVVLLCIFLSFCGDPVDPPCPAHPLLHC